jgi:hypothetical protein
VPTSVAAPSSTRVAQGETTGPRAMRIAPTSGANRLPSVHGSSDKGMTTWGRGCVGILRSRRGAAVVPLLEVRSGVLADRWSRSRIKVLACVALLLSSTIGRSQPECGDLRRGGSGVGRLLRAEFRDGGQHRLRQVLEGTGSSELYEAWIGRVRMVESGAFVLSALAGGVLTEATSARTTYFATLPFAAAIVGFLRFEEPRLHRAAGPTSLRSHLALTLRPGCCSCRLPSRSAGSAASRACRGRAVAPEGGGVRPAGGC